MKLYNTLTRQKEELKTIKEGEIGIYACGPTVYNFIHIGNARPICVFDVLRRFLEWRGIKVRYIQNFTDVDDKIIKKANEEGVPSSEISERYIKEYKKDAAGLNILEATVHPKVTENMDNIITFVDTLVKKGAAYLSGGDVYFRTAAFSGYGKLSHMPLEELEAGARIDVSEQKEHPMDFALWKAAKEGEPFWESPFGKGRPGWHIECSAMARRYLGENIDIHCGGQDLIFPHHENEIAQSESANEKPYANFWLHNGYINVDNKKMSKSEGNFFTVREIAEKYGYEPIRFLVISAHYRSPLNFSKEALEQSVSALDRLYSCRNNLDFALKTAPIGIVSEEKKQAADERKQQFITAMEDDFNIADAVAALFELTRDINSMLSGASREELLYVKTVFDELANVLGLLYERKASEVPEEIEELAQRRDQARKEKDFALADRLRDELREKGYAVEDTPKGIRIVRL